MTKPLVSIHMITYNHAPYVAQAIDGVLQQKTEFPIELIIGEDCSTDGTRQMVADYRRKYHDIVRVITSEANVGARKNFNRTVKACHGEFVAFCEGDDFWHNPRKLQLQVEYLESHPDCALVFADCNIYNEGLKELRESIHYSRGCREIRRLNVEEVLFGSMGRTCTAVVRRKLLDRVVEGDPYLHGSGYFLMGDTQLWTEIAAIAEVAYLPVTVATYRVRNNSASHSEDPIKQLRFSKSVEEMKLYLCKKYKLSDELRKAQEDCFLGTCLNLAFLEGNSELAEEVRRGKEVLTLREWIKYVGAKNTVAKSLCRLLRKKPKKDAVKWY